MACSGDAAGSRDIKRGYKCLPSSPAGWYGPSFPLHCLLPRKLQRKLLLFLSPSSLARLHNFSWFLSAVLELRIQPCLWEGGEGQGDGLS